MELVMDMQPELTNSKQIIGYLADKFPKCFTIEGEAKPLKIGIFQDIADRLAEEPSFSKTKLRVALRSYTANWRYLHCIKEGAHRVDLDGNECEVIGKEQAEHAKSQLKESKDKVKAKRIQQNSTQTPSDAKPRSQKPFSKSNDKSAKKPKPTRATTKTTDNATKVDVNQLSIGSNVKVMLGSKPVPATVCGIEKENVKVKIPSGMELTVTVAHLLT
ncbi:RNA chaperone ProQ [Orbaceae bacterium ac157xtp]